MVLLIIQIKNTMKENGKLFFIREQEPNLSILFTTVSLIQEQCWAPSKGSLDTWRMNELYLLLCTKGRELQNFMPVHQIVN